MKTFDQYHRQREPFNRYPGQGSMLGAVYCGLALAGESGEFAEKIKKMWRDDDLVLTPARREAMLKEAGDVLWYLDALVTELGSDLADVAEMNIEKLSERRETGTLHGEGDEREKHAHTGLNLTDAAVQKAHIVLAVGPDTRLITHEDATLKTGAVEVVKDRVGTLTTAPILRFTFSEWCRAKGVTVVDYDGLGEVRAMDGAPALPATDMLTPMPEAEFERRLIECTIGPTRPQPTTPDPGVSERRGAVDPDVARDRVTPSGD